MTCMEGSNTAPIGSWLRCYRCWSQELEVQVHYEGIHRIDAVTGERAEVVDEIQEAVVQCLDCMHDQPHLAFQGGRIEPVEDRWERMVAGTPWVASCTVTVDADAVETCSGPEAADALAYLDDHVLAVGRIRRDECEPQLLLQPPGALFELGNELKARVDRS